MSADDDGRPAQRDPEALLRQIEAAERAEHRGQLKIFLGYASGVGKSFKLFDEGRRRRERGEDVVVAATQPDSTPDVAQVIRTLESDSDARRRRCARSSTCRRSSRVTRRSAWSTAWRTTTRPAAGTRKRYEDVEELLEAGISVLTSINLEYIAEQQEFVRGILGTDEDRDRAAGLHRPRRRSRRRRCAAGGGRDDRGAAALAASPARAAADGRRRRSSARSVSAAARHPIVVGHAGTDSRLHDAASERRRRCWPADGGTPIASTASSSPST